MSVLPKYRQFHLLVAVFGLLHGRLEGKDVIIEPGNATVVSLLGQNETAVTVGDIPSNFSVVLFQAHSQYENVSISSTQTFDETVTIMGSHLGILTLLKVGDTSATMYLKSDVNTSLSVLVSADLHTPSDPLPGGCNEIFKLENDPNIHLKTFKYSTQFQFQWANLGFVRQGQEDSCEDHQQQLSYDIYVFFLPEMDQSEDTFLANIRKMLNARVVMENGIKLMTITNTGSTKSVGSMSSAVGQGLVLTIVVTDTKAGTSAIYVPAHTYSCQFQDGSCSRSVDAVDVVIAIVSAICGLFLCFLGHRYIKTEFFLFGFLAFALISYVMITRLSELNSEAAVGASVAVGVVGGAMFLVFWYYCGLPVVSVLLVGLTAGYLVSSLLFFTPFGNLSYWHTTVTYGLTFTCGLLIMPVFLLCFTKTLNILSCTFVGSYLCVLCVDVFLWSSLKYIILNSVNHQTLPEYLNITNIFPFETNEVILTVLWAGLFIVGTVFQFYRERKKPPFPPCPAHVKKARRLERPLSHQPEDEQRPLLKERSWPDYSQGQGQVNNQPT
ncbi:transmembrane 7 superfamily member 3-like [Haliotis rufescens]|uniref:transmembrane 7 superfamily member 3-like n=1 Tax=Haliotis rufescens TaxID=6454 RepID=UPI00201E9D98|nr:transmembrane 7 superfamily member 3-like [Haliotis rufescens]